MMDLNTSSDSAANKLSPLLTTATSVESGLSHHNRILLLSSPSATLSTANNKLLLMDDDDDEHIIDDEDTDCPIDKVTTSTGANQLLFKNRLVSNCNLSRIYQFANSNNTNMNSISNTSTTSSNNDDSNSLNLLDYMPNDYHNSSNNSASGKFVYFKISTHNPS
jgi:hypothetical protein